MPFIANSNERTYEWVGSLSATGRSKIEELLGVPIRSGRHYQIITNHKRAQEAVFEIALELDRPVHISRTKLGSYLLRWDDDGEGQN